MRHSAKHLEASPEAFVVQLGSKPADEHLGIIVSHRAGNRMAPGRKKPCELSGGRTKHGAVYIAYEDNKTGLGGVQ